MKVFEAIADAVAREGVQVVFSLVDEVTLALVHSLNERGVRVIRARHEQAAVAMADGYARATGKPGVCTVGAGPALAQTGTGLVTARKRGSPVLVIAGDMPTSERTSVKTFDQRRYVEATAGQFLPLRNTMTVAEDVQRAFRYVYSGRGPLVLDLPADSLEADVPWQWEYQPSSVTRRGGPGPLRLQPDADTVAGAAAMLAAARRPVILAGKGAVLSGAREEIEALASRVGALLATTLQAREYFRGHPSYVGVFGTFAADPAVELLAQADCVLAVGASLNRYTTGGGRLAPKAKLIHIDLDPARISEFTPVDLGIVGDAQATLEAINNALQAAGIAERPSAWPAEHVRERIDAAHLRPAVTASAPGERPHITEIVAGLDRILPEDRLVVIDAGQFIYFVMDGITVSGPDAFIWSVDFGSIGLGLAMGIGAAVARPDRHCVVFTGDGGLMMGLQELDTAARHRIPLTVVALNDAAYGSEVRFLKSRSQATDLALFQDVDFAGVARSFGVRGVTVNAVADLEHVAESLAQGDGPLLVDAKITCEVRHRLFKDSVRLSR
ncbi:MAG: thiamine pyrophosphate-binding protein [Chloroflexi bacterium]|nr:thiamine pyrophosphate-binding protein [Chloroflexota bacterium]